MKKFLSLFLCLTCILTLAACGKKAAPITLPQADKITSIDITFEENTVSHSDNIKIDFRLETGTITIFAYEDRGKYYLEQPYQGIYKTDRKLFERLNETD